MPMFRKFVPEFIRPWIFVIFAACFQLSGGVYMGALNEIIGATSYTREDISMCLYCNLAGMACYFPILFRMKFRFSNKTLLFTAATIGAICQIAGAYAPNLPILWAVCFVAGMCKIQGTFECMSNIQLWMSPTRDFRVFFPILHIFILGSMQISDFVGAYIAYAFEWQYTHFLMAGIFMCVALIVVVCTQRIHILPKFPLFGIDWVGSLMWAALLFELTYIFNYGEQLDWWNSSTIRNFTYSTIATALLVLLRTLSVRHPWIDPWVFTFKKARILFIFTAIAELFLATEYVCEEVFMENALGYSTMANATLDLFMFLGCIAGCIFSLIWLKMFDRNKFRLITIGFIALCTYLVMYYNLLYVNINIEKLYLPIAIRGFAYAVISITCMLILELSMPFPIFFQSLSVFNMLHMVIGGVLGTALYTQMLKYYIVDNIARYGNKFDHVMMGKLDINFGNIIEQYIIDAQVISIKQIYGWVAYGCIFFTILLCLYKMPTVQRGIAKMLNWRTIGKTMRIAHDNE